MSIEEAVSYALDHKCKVSMRVECPGLGQAWSVMVSYCGKTVQRGLDSFAEGGWPDHTPVAEAVKACVDEVLELVREG